VKILQDVWKINKSGIVIFHRAFKESMSPQAFGAMMSALNSFAEQLTEGGLSNFELYNKKFTLVKKINLTFIANSSKEYNQKKINRELEKISKKFLKLYSKDLEKYQGQIGAFTKFEQIIKNSLEENT
jgi:hypothetical protein